MSFLAVARLSQSLGATCARQQCPMRTYTVSARMSFAGESRLPRIANPTFWSSLVPRAFKRAPDVETAAAREKVRVAGYEERRAAIAFLVLGILVGSNAINLISLRREMLNFSRLTDAKLALLRETVQRVKNGEDVDVQAALGTGDPKAEQEWEQVIRELETTDMLEQGTAKREAKREAKRMAKAEQKEESDARTNEPAQAARPKFIM